MTPTGPRLADAARAAVPAVFAVFALAGLHFSTWAARLPTVRDTLGLDPGQMGMLLLVIAAGSIVGLPLSGAIVQRIGTAHAVRSFAFVNAFGLVVAAVGVSLAEVVVVALGMIMFGLGTGVWDAAMNIEGAAVEQARLRSIMPALHAGFSFGTILGAGVAAVAARMGASLLVHVLCVLAVSLVVVVLAVRRFLPRVEPEPQPAVVGASSGMSSDGTGDAVTAVGADPATGREPAPSGRPGPTALTAWVEPRTLVVGLVVLAAALTEGAANDWVALAVVDGFDQPESVGALVFGVFVTAMTGMRLLGTWLLDRWGRVAVLRLCGALSLAGLLVFGLVGPLWLAVVGVVAWGAGAAIGFPVGMSAAADDRRYAAPRVAVVSTIGYTAFLAGPPLLGLIAQHVGYRHALLAVAVPVVIGLLAVPAVRPVPAASRSSLDG